MQILARQYCLRNNDKKRRLDMFSTEASICFKYFQSETGWIPNMERTDATVWLYKLQTLLCKTPSTLTSRSWLATLLQVTSVGWRNLPYHALLMIFYRNKQLRHCNIFIKIFSLNQHWQNKSDNHFIITAKRIMLWLVKSKIWALC
jgi:hypothetical protein